MYRLNCGLRTNLNIKKTLKPSINLEQLDDFPHGLLTWLISTPTLVYEQGSQFSARNG